MDSVIRHAKMRPVSYAIGLAYLVMSAILSLAPGAGAGAGSWAHPISSFHGTIIAFGRVMAMYTANYGSLPCDDRGEQYAVYRLRSVMESDYFARPGSLERLFTWNHSCKTVDNMQIYYLNKKIHMFADAEPCVLVASKIVGKNGTFCVIDSNLSTYECDPENGSSFDPRVCLGMAVGEMKQMSRVVSTSDCHITDDMRREIEIATRESDGALTQAQETHSIVPARSRWNVQDVAEQTMKPSTSKMPGHLEEWKIILIGAGAFVLSASLMLVFQRRVTVENARPLKRTKHKDLLP